MKDLKALVYRETEMIVLVEVKHENPSIQQVNEAQITILKIS